jgi:hypothetical protein
MELDATEAYPSGADFNDKFHNIQLANMHFSKPHQIKQIDYGNLTGQIATYVIV